MPTFCSPKLQR